MRNGFKRLMDFSPLSMKNLNDQLEQMWLKMMGGISYRDLDKGTRTIIDGKTNEKDVISIIEQRKDEILLAVGSPGGDNLIKNGDWAFGNESWVCTSASIHGDYMLIETGNIVQNGIRIEGGRAYTLGFEGYGNKISTISVVGQQLSGSKVLLVQKLTTVGATSNQYTANFKAPQGIDKCYIKVESKGSFYVRKVYIREGEGVNKYTSNPNEIKGSGISITENAVNISTPSFNLDIQDESGKVTSVLTADGPGFDNMQCNNMTIINRKYYGEGGRHIYVNSISGRDSNSGASTYQPFRTIGRALKEVPLHILDTYTIHLTGGTYNENLFFNYGGSGLLIISGESATVNGHINIHGAGYNLSFQNMKIYTTDSYCFKGVGRNSFIEMIGCVLDGNSMKSAIGIGLNYGTRMYIKHCEINNCRYAIHCIKGSYLDIVDCKGNHNGTAIYVSDMAIVNSEGTVPFADVINEETDGGRIDGFIVASVVGTNYQDERAAIKRASFSAAAKFSFVGGKMVNGLLRQGAGCGAYLSFSTDKIVSLLRGRLIKSVRVIVERKADANTKDGILVGYSHNLSSSSEKFSYKTGYGSLVKVRRGEQVHIELPLSIIEEMISGNAKGVLFYSQSMGKEYCFDLSNSFDSRLEVLYV